MALDIFSNFPHRNGSYVNTLTQWQTECTDLFNRVAIAIQRQTPRFDQRGRRISLGEWLALTSDSNYITVAHDQTPTWEVFTLWTGMDEDINDNEAALPMTFETHITLKRGDGFPPLTKLKKSAAEQAALMAHRAIVESLRKGPPVSMFLLGRLKDE